MKYFIDDHQINSGIQILKRQVVFESATDDAVAELCIVDTPTDAKIITHNKKVLRINLNALN